MDLTPEERELIARMAVQIKDLGDSMRRLTAATVEAVEHTRTFGEYTKREGPWPPYDH